MSFSTRQDLIDKAQNGELYARDMCDADLQQVLQIEQIAQASPWGRLSFEESLSKEHYCRVLHIKDEVVAYHIVCPVLDELHILNVVAAVSLQGLGLGHRLMQDIVEIAERNQLSKLFLEVRASNTVAQSLYEKWQFKQIALRKKYYRPTGPAAEREDALVYLRRLED